MDLSSLNKEQLAAVLDTEGAKLVTAGAGSGKTRLLTHRIAHLIDKGASPYSILAITFTNKAASEMKERLDKMLDGTMASGGVWVSTFHSMCVKMLRRFSDKIGFNKNFSIYAEAEKERLIKSIYKEKFGSDDSDKNDKDEIKDIISAISKAKNLGLDPDEYKKQFDYVDNIDRIFEIFTEYEIQKKKNNAFDFDDLLAVTLLLLKTDTEAREFYSNKFKYILVDEFQDTNDVQYQIVKLLASKHKNIMCVGDEDQNIYSWRGASISNLDDFRNDFSVKFYKLEQNYRSSKKILDLANNLIENNKSRIKKNLWTQNAEGEKPEFYAAENEASEADFVIKNIIQLKRYHNYSNSDFAILMRVNALTRSFEEKCIQYGIGYRVTGGFKFYERKEIKDILAYLRICANSDDSEAIGRVINFPKRGIGDKAIAQLQNYCAIENKRLYDIILDIEKNDDLPKALAKKVAPFSQVLALIAAAKEQLNIFELITYIIRLLDLKEVYSADTEENENRKQNLKELVGAIESYVKLNPSATVDEYLQNVSLYSDTDELDTNADFLNIATVHSAKGLEFNCVFIVGLEEGVLPISRSFDSESELEEERRLLYVAITRAKQRLFLSLAQSRFMYGQRKLCMPSRFLSELGFSVPKPKPLYEDEFGFGGRSYGGGFGKSYGVASGGGFGYNNSYSNSSYNSYQSQKNANTPFASHSSQTTTNQTPSHLPPKKESVDLSDFKVGSKVVHKKFGTGTIVSVTGTKDNAYGEIDFEFVGKLNLSLNYAPLTQLDEN